MAAVLNAVAGCAVVMVHASGKTIRAPRHTSSRRRSDVNTVVSFEALILGGTRVAFAGCARPNHTANAFSISNETVVHRLAKLAFVAVIDLINIGAARDALKAEAG